VYAFLPLKLFLFLSYENDLASKIYKQFFAKKLKIKCQKPLIFNLGSNKKKETHLFLL